MKRILFSVSKSFSKSNYESKVNRIQNLTSKARMKETVADRKRLGEFLQKEKIKNTIGVTMQRTSSENFDFKNFLKEFHDKHKDYPTLIDLSHYVKDWDSLNKSPEIRKEELELLNDFRRRKELAGESVKVSNYLIIV